MTLLKDQPKEFLKRGFNLPITAFDRDTPFDTYDTRLIVTYTKPVISNEIEVDVCFVFELNEAGQKVSQIEACVNLCIDNTATETTIKTFEQLRDLLYYATQIGKFLKTQPCKPKNNPQ